MGWGNEQVEGARRSDQRGEREEEKEEEFDGGRREREEERKGEEGRGEGWLGTRKSHRSSFSDRPKVTVSGRRPSP